jgi:pantoate--beta-alanine ligase
MTILRTVHDVRHHLADLRGTTRIGLVPTMGALHEGHVRCFEAARRASGYVVATIFVNPTQFTDPADLAAYPRTEARDVEVAMAAGVDALFIPGPDVIYPPGDATVVDPRGAALGFEGDMRPGHFRGVATVCAKLFGIVRPDVAFFGQKDAQQVAVIRQLVRDLFLDFEIVVVPTLRAEDGLALSSRNARLSDAERERARGIPRALVAGLAAHAAGRDPVAAARATLDRLHVDYVAVTPFDDQPTLVVAARAGATRLIDNVPLDQPELADIPRAGAGLDGSEDPSLRGSKSRVP